MNNPDVKKKFSWKSFTSIGLFYSGFIITVTGIVLYLTPTGRVAYWINWKLLGLTKTDWQAVHTIFSIVFLIFSVFHLFTFNWRLFLSYLKQKTKSGMKKRELLYSTILTVVLYIGVIYYVPPFNYIMDFGDYLTDSWETDETAPPVPHAELLTLTELAQELDSVPVNRIIQKLDNAGIKFNDTDKQTLKEIAEENNKTPMEIYDIIAEKKTGYSPMQGSGLGRKSLEKFASEYDKDVNELLKILEENGIKASEDQTLREIAAENDKTPYDIYELIK